MNPRIKKEIRNLLPACLAGMALMTLTILTPAKSMPLFLLLAFCTSCVLVSITSLGTDLLHATLPVEMALPISRERRWRERHLVLLLMLGLVCAVYAGIVYERFVLLSLPTFTSLELLVAAIFAVPLLTVALGTFFTLWLGDTGAAGISTAISGLVIASIVVHIDGLQVFASTKIVPIILTGVIASLFMWLASRKFVGFEDYNPLTKPFAVSSTARASGTSSKRKPGTVVRLARTELRLQTINLFACSAIWLTSTLFNAGGPSWSWHAAASVAWVLIWPFPLLFGAASIAEEHRQGMHAYRLSLPVSACRQWIIKFATNCGLSLVIGIGTLVLLDLQGFAIDGQNPLDYLLWFIVVSFAGVGVGMAASTLATSYISALGIPVLFAAAAAVVGIVVPYLMPQSPIAPAYKLYHIVGGISTALALTCGSYFAFRRTERLSTRWGYMAISVAISLVITSILTAGIYYRSWEYFESRPADGPKVIPRDNLGRLRAIHTDNYIGGDGRLYRGDDISFIFRRSLEHRLFSPRTPSHETNWTQLVMNSPRHLFALKSDGTVWYQGSPEFEKSKERNPEWARMVFDFPATLSRFGSESNWNKIAGSFTHFAGIKQDGTLWQWGSANQSSFGFTDTNRFQTLRQPKQVGSSGNWIDVSLFYSICLALNDEGVLCHWGNINPMESQQQQRFDEEYLRPVPVPVPEFAGIKVSKIIDPSTLLLSDGSVALNWSIYFPQRVAGLFPTVIKPHPDHPHIFTVDPIINPRVARHLANPIIQYLIANDGRLLKVDRKRPPAEWEPFDSTTTWVEQYQYRLHSIFLKQDGSVWQCTFLSHYLPHHQLLTYAGQKKPTWKDLPIIPPRFRMHRVGFLSEVNRKDAKSL